MLDTVVSSLGKLQRCPRRKRTWRHVANLGHDWVVQSWSSALSKPSQVIHIGNLVGVGLSRLGRHSPRRILRIFSSGAGLAEVGTMSVFTYMHPVSLALMRLPRSCNVS